MTPLLAQATSWAEGRVVETGIVLLATAAAWLILDRIGHRAIERLATKESARQNIVGEERAQRIRTLWSVGRLVLTGVALLVVVLLTFDIWGIPTTPFVALGSVIGVALGFGAQDVVKDVLAGMFILAEDQYGIGDVVEIADVSGTVQAIRLRTTVLRDLDGNVHHVPNGQIVVASNFTQTYAQVVVDIGVSYDEDVDEVMAVLGDEAAMFVADEEWGRKFLGEPEMLGVERLDDSAVVLRISLRVRPADRWAVRREFLRRVKRRFDRDGISIPYPHVTVVGDPPSGASAPPDPGGQD